MLKSTICQLFYVFLLFLAHSCVDASIYVAAYSAVLYFI